MGTSCCKKNDFEKYDNVDECENISDIRNYIETIIKRAELDEEEIKNYLNDKTKIPKTVEIADFSEEEIKKRVSYLEEMKNCLNEIDELLKKHPNVSITDVINSLKEFQTMYGWIYDDSKRYSEWFKVFKKFVESQ